ncbi:MAG: fimbria/pilus periplasmic chaperone [Betaproteobacteria bacterium]
MCTARRGWLAMPRGTLLTGLAALSLALAASLPVSAGSIAVAPLKLTFSPGSGIASITVENNGREAALVQAETFAWSQAEGEHKLNPTDDVVAVPPVFRLAAGAQQLVRVGLTRAFTGDQERTFRLTVTELPSTVAPGTVAVAVRHSLPIFVLPANAISPHLTVTRAAAGGLEVANRGSQHLRINRWRLRDGNGAILAEDSGPGYLLAGARQPLAGAVPRSTGPTVFEADIDARTLKIAVGD